MNDAELIATLPQLARRESEQTADFLAHLAELDERRLFLELGFRSMWEYCTVALKICETSAWRRITAARVCRQFPEAFALVAKGELQLSVLAALSKRITPSNASELFEACRDMSIRHVEQLLAARFPSPDVPDLVRRLPARPSAPTQVVVESTSRAGSDTGAESLDQKATVAALPASGQAAITPASRQGSFEPLSTDRFAVRFTADTEFLQLLEQVRDLASHRIPPADLLSTLRASLLAYRCQLLKTRFAVGRKPRATSRSSHSTTAAQVGRGHVPAAVAREVYERDCGQCSYVSKAGRRCSARRTLELDHIEPSAVGGLESAQNLRLRCRAHNQHYARQYFGRSYMRAVMKRVRSTRADYIEGSPKQKSD